VAVDGSGNLYVADTNNHRVQKIVPVHATHLDDEPTQTDAVKDSAEIEDLAPGVYQISERLPGRWRLASIACTTSDTNQQPRTTPDRFKAVIELDGQEEASCTFANQLPSRIKVVKDADPADGAGFWFQAGRAGPPRYLAQWGSGGEEAGQLNYPAAAAVDESSGDVYVADTLNQRVVRYDADGGFLRMWGWGVDTGADAFEICTAASVPCQKGKSGGGGQLNVPLGIAVYADGGGTGSVYVADFNNHRVAQYDGDGTFVRTWGWGVDTGATAFEICTAASAPCKAGSFGAGDGQFYNPRALDVDGSGNVYVLDKYNYRIQKFDGSGGYLDKWGSQGSAPTSSWTPAAWPCTRRAAALCWSM
jgi:DNA-binding beta-propeller fold protein YncE